MLIQHASLLNGTVVDVRVGEHIDEVGAALEPRGGENVLDARCGTLLPGLHDHHVHLHSAAAALDSLSVGPSVVGTNDQLAQALSNAKPGADGWIRAVGYHESVAGELNRGVLDTLVPDTPVRIQHRSGVLWMLNSAALSRVGLAEHLDGRVRSDDRRWGEMLARREADLATLSRRLIALGVTGVTDASPELEADDMVSLANAHRRGEFAPRLHFLAPGKKILHDDRLDLDALTDWITAAHIAGRAVAVHCVTAAQLVVTLAALDAAGADPGDRIEHAAIVPDDSLGELARLGVTVVTQPNFVAERGDHYLAELPAAEHRELWRVASLLKANVRVALSTDMPFGHGDPWAAMRAAVHRRTPGGAVLNAGERISARTALTMFFGWADEPSRPRTVEPGQPADLCVLSTPPAAALAELNADTVAATIIGGQLAYTAQ